MDVPEHNEEFQGHRGPVPELLAKFWRQHAFVVSPLVHMQVLTVRALQAR